MHWRCRRRGTASKAARCWSSRAALTSKTGATPCSANSTTRFGRRAAIWVGLRTNAAHGWCAPPAGNTSSGRACGRNYSTWRRTRRNSATWVRSRDSKKCGRKCAIGCWTGLAAASAAPRSPWRKSRPGPPPISAQGCFSAGGALASAASLMKRPRPVYLAFAMRNAGARLTPCAGLGWSTPDCASLHPGYACFDR
jgi:hypothetical protein